MASVTLGVWFHKNYLKYVSNGEQGFVETPLYPPQLHLEHT